MKKIKKIELKENLLAANEALLLASLRQHELAEASDNLSKQLYLMNAKLHSEIAERQKTELALVASETQYRTLFNSIDEGFCVIEKIDTPQGEPSDFLYVDANPSFEKESGIGGVVGKTIRAALPQEPQEWFDIYDAVLRDGIPQHFERTLATTGRILELYAFPIEHTLRPRVAVIFRDITSRKQAEILAQRLAAIVKSSDDAIISTDVDGNITSWNHGAEQLFGYSAAESIGKSVTILLPPGQRGEESGILERIRNGLRTEPSDAIRRRRDGSTVWVSLSVSPLRDARGGVIGASEIIRDMTERRHADELRDILVNELNHRAKNSLAMVRAIASQTLATSTSLEEAKLAFDARLGALARGHDLLTHANWVGTDLGSVIGATIEPHGGGDRFQIKGPVVKLSPATALIFTMAIHELCTNAAKYGALSEESGLVTIVWHVTGEGTDKHLHLKWKETNGPPVTPPKRKGFGSRLVEKALAMELRGKVRIDYEISGVSCTIVAPLPEGKEKVKLNVA